MTSTRQRNVGPRSTVRAHGEARTFGRRAVASFGVVAALTLGMIPAARGDDFGDRICVGVSVAIQYDSDAAFVSCSNSDQGVVSYAVRGASTRAAANMLAVALTARASNKPLYVRFRRTAGTVPGCDLASCRELLWIGDWQ